MSHLHPWVWDWYTDYQRAGVEWARGRESCIFRWCTGSGKTAASLGWASHATRVLVVTKAPVRNQFKREVERLTDWHVQIAEGQTPYTLVSPFVVTSWELLPYWKAYLCEWLKGGHAKGGHVIFDELHKGKNWKRQEETWIPGHARSTWVDKDNSVSAAAAQVSAAASCRLGMTATMVRNTRMDLWSQLDIIQPGKWGKNWFPFAKRYCAGRPGEYGFDTSGKSNSSELHRRLTSVVNRVDQAVVNTQLPGKRRRVVILDRASQAKAAAFTRQLKNKRLSRQEKFELLLRQASSRKWKYIQEAVAEACRSGQKVTVLTGRRREVEVLDSKIKAGLKGLAVPPLVLAGHGGHTVTVRDKMCTDYMDAAGPAVLIGTIDAFGEGLNLQDTDLALVAMLPWTSGQLVQLEGRFHRLGQERPVLIEYLVCEDTVDEHVMEVLLSKLDLVNATFTEDAEMQGLMRDLKDIDPEAMVDSILSWL